MTDLAKIELICSKLQIVSQSRRLQKYPYHSPSEVAGFSTCRHVHTGWKNNWSYTLQGLWRPVLPLNTKFDCDVYKNHDKCPEMNFIRSQNHSPDVLVHIDQTTIILFKITDGEDSMSVADVEVVLQYTVKTLQDSPMDRHVWVELLIIRNWKKDLGDSVIVGKQIIKNHKESLEMWIIFNKYALGVWMEPTWAWNAPKRPH